MTNVITADFSATPNNPSSTSAHRSPRSKECALQDGLEHIGIASARVVAELMIKLQKNPY